MTSCDYCHADVPLLTIGHPDYPYRRDYGPVYTCAPCGAWVGCHSGTRIALGRLANAELRAAKMAAHAAFDPLWERKIAIDKCNKGYARRAGYKWLAGQLGLPVYKTHIGHFDIDQCNRVIAICCQAHETK
jgi:hypothetical protein